MSTIFDDVNGKTIVPGCIVVVAVETQAGAQLRRGRVQQTKLGRYSWNRNIPSITLRDIDNNRYIGTYRSPQRMMIVEPKPV